MNFSFGSNQPGFKNIDAPHLNDNKEAYRIIDVRGFDEFTGPLGHIPSSELVSLETLPQFARDWDKTTPLAVVCHSGGRSSQASSYLVELGFENVNNLAGGMLGWNSFRFNTCRDSDHPQSASSHRTCMESVAQ